MDVMADVPPKDKGKTKLSEALLLRDSAIMKLCSTQFVTGSKKQWIWQVIYSHSYLSAF